MNLKVFKTTLRDYSGRPISLSGACHETPPHRQLGCQRLPARLRQHREPGEPLWQPHPGPELLHAPKGLCGHAHRQGPKARKGHHCHHRGLPRPLAPVRAALWPQLAGQKQLGRERHVHRAAEHGQVEHAKWRDRCLQGAGQRCGQCPPPAPHGRAGRTRLQHRWRVHLHFSKAGGLRALCRGSDGHRRRTLRAAGAARKVDARRAGFGFGGCAGRHFFTAKSCPTW